MPLTSKKAGRSGLQFGQKKSYQRSAQEQSERFAEHATLDCMRTIPALARSVAQFLQRGEFAACYGKTATFRHVSMQIHLWSMPMNSLSRLCPAAIMNAINLTVFRMALVDPSGEECKERSSSC